MFATLGKIAFSALSGFTSLQETAGTDFAEHALVRGKPRLQFMGERLDELNVGFGFYHWFCAPRRSLERLRKIKSQGQALALCFGNGDFRGYFVVTELEVNYEQTDGSGNITAVVGTLKLREFIGDPAKPQAPAVSPFALPPNAVGQAPAVQPVQPGVALTPNQVLPGSAAVLSGANRVAGMVERAALVAQQALAMPSTAQAGAVVAALDEGLMALGSWLPLAVTVGQAVPALAEMAAPYRGARGLLVSGRSALDGARRSNVAAKLAWAAADVVAADAALRAGAADRARLAAIVGARV
jgi:phage protein U